MELNSREIALIFWLAATVALLLWKAKLWPLLVALSSTLLKARKLLKLLGLMTVHVIGSVLLLHSNALWTGNQLKETGVWFFTFALVAIRDAVVPSKSGSFLGRMLRESVGATVLVQFVVDAYAFPLIIEMALAPVVIGAAIASGVSKSNIVQNSVAVVLTFLAIAMLVNSFVRISGDASFFAVNNLREFLCPVLLTLLLLPFLFVVNLYSAYEGVFLRLNFSLDDATLRRFARFHAGMSFGADVSALSRWARCLAMNRPRSRDEIRRITFEVKAAQRRDTNPPQVPALLGWSVGVARDFLAAEGLRLRSYDDFGDLWRGSSNYLNLGNGILASNILYGVEGDAIVVKRIWITLSVNEPGEAQSNYRSFLQVAGLLVQKALGIEHSEGVQLLDEVVAHGSLELGRTGISFAMELWPGGIKDGHEVTLTISNLMP